MIMHDIDLTVVAQRIMGTYLSCDILIIPELKNELIQEIDNVIATEQKLISGELPARPRPRPGRIAHRVDSTIHTNELRAMARHPEMRRQLIAEIDAVIANERIVFSKMNKYQQIKKTESAHKRYQDDIVKKSVRPVVGEYPQYSTTSLYNIVRKFKRAGRPIPDELHAELKRRDPYYDPEKCGFKRKPISEQNVVNPRRTDYSNSSTASLIRSARYRMLRGATIPQEMLDELDMRNFMIIPNSHSIVRKRKTTTPAEIKTDGKEIAGAEINMAYVRASALGAARRYNVVSQTELPADTYRDKEILTVSVTPGTTGNRIAVNGKTVLENHRDTQIRILLAGQILGIFGVPQNQENPSWVLMNTALKLIPGMLKTDPTLTVRSVQDTARATTVTMATNTNLTFIYKYNDALKRAFQIATPTNEK